LQSAIILDTRRLFANKSPTFRSISGPTFFGQYEFLLVEDSITGWTTTPLT